MSNSSDIKIIDLPKIEDPRGNLSFMQYPDQVPFAIKRCYWVYDVPGGAERHGHAFRHQEELIVALSGSFDVVLHNGAPRERRHLSTNSVALILSSTEYDEADYIRDYEEFKRLVNIENH